MEAKPEQKNAMILEMPADHVLVAIWQELPAEKRREALQALAQLLVKRVEEGRKKVEQPV